MYLFLQDLDYLSRIFALNSIFKCLYLQCLGDEIGRTKEEFIVEYFTKYDNPAYPPVWKSLEVASFGTLSKMYSNFAVNASQRVDCKRHRFIIKTLSSIVLSTVSP